MRLEAEGTPVLLCLPVPDNNAAFRISDPATPETPNVEAHFISDAPDLFIRRLRQLGIRHVHIHNLAGYAHGMARYLAEGLAGSRLSYDITVHDYLHWCPRIELVGITGQYCGEPDLTSCESCVRHLGSPIGVQSVWAWRQDYEGLFRGARKIFAPSNDTAERVKRQLPGLRVRVLPHELVTVSTRRERGPTAKSGLRVGVIGAIGESKGREVLAKLAAYASEHRANVKIVLFGYANREETLTSTGKVRVTGRYDEADLESLMDRERIDVIFIPAVWPETYSYTLTAALKTGLPIVSFDLGAVAERLRAHGVGTILPLDLAWSPREVLARLIGAARGRRARKGTVQSLPYSDLLADYYELAPRAATRSEGTRGG